MPDVQQSIDERLAPWSPPHPCACHRDPAVARLRGEKAHLANKKSLAPKDLGALDPCDKHRDEGEK